MMMADCCSMVRVSQAGALVFGVACDLLEDGRACLVEDYLAGVGDFCQLVGQACVAGNLVELFLGWRVRRRSLVRLVMVGVCSVCGFFVFPGDRWRTALAADQPMRVMEMASAAAAVFLGGEGGLLEAEGEYDRGGYGGCGLDQGGECLRQVQMIFQRTQSASGSSWVSGSSDTRWLGKPLGMTARAVWICRNGSAGWKVRPSSLGR